MSTYHPDQTKMKEAAARCGLRVKARGYKASPSCVLVDEHSGTVVYEGQMWPGAWQFMREQRGLQVGVH